MINKDIFTALNLLEEKGYEAFLVGGAVRNHLLTKTISDYDITTNADPNAIKMIFSNYHTYDIGKKLGTIIVVINKLKIDITPYRKESDYANHRRPETIEFSNNLKDDLKRRDFTINALCLDKNSNIIDLYKGIDDLNNKVIRCIGNPDQRFHEDGLRILRALRFKTKLNFEIEPKTKKSLFKNKDLLNYISCERKKDELLQILSCKNCFSTINEYLEIFNTFIPFKHEDRKINNFSNPLYTLAYLLKDNKINLKKLKYSKEEIELINTLIDVSNIDIEDDYNFICCLSDINQKHILTYLNELHHKNYNDRYNSLHKYMITINELNIDGNTLQAYGYKDKQIKQIKNELLDLVHHKKLQNTSRSLNSYLKKL